MSQTSHQAAEAFHPSMSVPCLPPGALDDARFPSWPASGTEPSATPRIGIIDPSDARVWPRHARGSAQLSEHGCADLIASFKAQGRQEIPAIVRPLAGDPQHAYEVICGARRLWAAGWLRAHGHPGFGFLVEVRMLDDEAAFLLADLDSRTRRDLSDYERARDYARALDWYYGGNQQRMAERLNVGRSWLSRFLELAKLPPDVVKAFGSPDAIGISHGAALAPVLRLPQARERILRAAAALGGEQAELHARTGARIAPAAVLERLVAAARRPRPPRSQAARERVVRDPDGSVVALGVKSAPGGGATIRIPAPARHERAALMRAFAELLEWFAARAEDDGA